jgi:hypothetical protein
VLVLPLTPATDPDDGPGEGLVDVVRHRLSGLPGERPLPTVAHYDQLLTRGPASTEPGPATG